jgi:hypothetical protein
MCQRTCPRCGSTDHFEGYGICGAYILCEGCSHTLAQRFDIAACPIDLTERQAEAYARKRTWVLPGAEAKDPADDAIFHRA